VGVECLAADVVDDNLQGLPTTICPQNDHNDRLSYDPRLVKQKMTDPHGRTSVALQKKVKQQIFCQPESV